MSSTYITSHGLNAANHNPTADIGSHQDTYGSAAHRKIDIGNGHDDDHMVDDDILTEQHTSDTEHGRHEESIIEDDTMSEDHDAAASHARSSSPTAQNGSSRPDEGHIEEEPMQVQGNADGNAAHKDPASEVSDTERVERLLSDPPEASAQTGHTEGSDTQAGGGVLLGEPSACAGSPGGIPPRPEASSVTGFMSLGKKPTLSLLPDLSMSDAPPSPPLRCGAGEGEASSATHFTTKKAQNGPMGGGDGGSDGGGGKVPFAPAGSSGRGSTPFVIGARKE